MSHFKPCKYLEYDEEKYGNTCELRNLGLECEFIRYWRRRLEADNCQFCKLRGRISAILDCYEPGCVDYKPKEET